MYIAGRKSQSCKKTWRADSSISNNSRINSGCTHGLWAAHPAGLLSNRTEQKGREEEKTIDRAREKMGFSGEKGASGGTRNDVMSLE